MDEWDRVNAVNVRAVFALTKECLPLLEAAGGRGPHASVINIASIDGIRIAADNDWAYGAGKAAVIHLTKQWAGRLGNKGGREGGRNITFNAIAPVCSTKSWPAKKDERRFLMRQLSVALGSRRTWELPVSIWRVEQVNT